MQRAAVALIEEDYLFVQLLVSIVDSISACHAEDRGSIPRRGDLVLYCCPKTHTKVLLQPRVTEGVGHTKGNALAGNRTRVNCLEGSYAHHYTTNAGGFDVGLCGQQECSQHISNWQVKLSELKLSLVGPGKEKNA